MFTPDLRQELRHNILEFARRDVRLVAGAITGSASVSQEDEWSDIDLAFAVLAGEPLSGVLDAFTSFVGEACDVVDTLDVVSGEWLYRVHLLGNTLQVDIAVAPESAFGARAKTFALIFGNAQDLRIEINEERERRSLLGYAWLYALHVRSSLARGKLMQADYMLTEMRNRIASLACLRCGIPFREARGTDRLPPEWIATFAASRATSCDNEELIRSFSLSISILMSEIESFDFQLSEAFLPTLLNLCVRQSQS